MVFLTYSFNNYLLSAPLSGYFRHIGSISELPDSPKEENPLLHLMGWEEAGSKRTGNKQVKAGSKRTGNKQVKYVVC